MESSDLTLPVNNSERGIFTGYLNKVAANTPLIFYVGSCPDYSHDGQYYTHQGISGDVPLLTIKHLAAAKYLFERLESQKILYEYVVMVADVEAMDQVFCDKFTQGDQSKFLDLCRSSIVSTTDFIGRNFTELKYGKVRSSSFFKEFGYDSFMETEQMYHDVLHRNYETGGSLRSRIYRDTYARMNMYRTMYDTVLPAMSASEREEFLIGRTERTMAQYLALGRLITQKGNLASIICHPTLNIGMFNDRNKVLLPIDNSRGVQATIPVFSMNLRVYS